MEPFIALVGVTLVLAVVGVLGVEALRPWVVPVRFGLVAMFLMTGVAHFVGMRDELIRMVPPALPAPGTLVTITGVLELVGVLGLARARTAMVSAAGLTLLMLAMFPANIHAANAHLSDSVSDLLPVRIAMELVFLTASVSVVVHGLRARRARTGHGVHLQAA